MSVWGALAERYETRPGEEPPPRKLLALDGGGIRGILTLEILHRIEQLVAEATGKTRLCDFFDFIGGTSTGAIIAAGLARGMSVSDLLSFYQQTGPAMFDKAFILNRLKYLYNSQPLADELKKTFGERTTLHPDSLKCLLLVVARNVTTDSPWPISSNPLAKYNDTARADCNLNIPLWQIVRASTAAPVFFAPEVLQWDANDPSKTFKFVDGGLTPYNNPAFLLSRMATQAPYRLNWKTGERNLLLISVGTGAAPYLDSNVHTQDNIAQNLANIPSALMYGAQVDQDINCRTVGRCVYGEPIDAELGDLIPRDERGDVIPLSQDRGRAFLYARYNADLSSRWLNKMGLGDIDPSKVSKLDSVEHIADLRRIGRRVAEEVKLEHFGSFV
ncbi:MAG TPA: patatin-like phospholipase family protein [Pyrinomonadaceae bacterium]|nr:patatin-like phospholipase family protein [Pyrinomonadaceae bacterium]